MAEAFRTILDGIQDLETSAADRIYLTQPLGEGRVRDITFREALDEARRMAAHLSSLGFAPGSHIALVTKNTAHFLIADFAIWLAGHVSIPIYPTLTGETVRLILEHSESKLLFVGKLDDWAAIRSGIPASLPTIALPLGPSEGGGTPWAEIIARTPPLAGRVTRGADELATIIYTSGTTGTPKGVMHSFRTMTISALGFVDYMEMGPNDWMLSYLPLAHAFERALVESTSMLSGMHLYFAESLDTFVADLKRARPTLFISVPRLWTKFRLGVLAKMPQQKLDRLLGIPLVGWFVRRKILKGLGLDACRRAGSGSAPIPGEVITWYRGLGLEMLEGYAMSENFCWSHLGRPGRTAVGSVGEACPGVECRLGSDGEVLVKSPANMLGYYKEPALSSETLPADGFLHTGDRGSIDNQGRLFLTGRTKELFKTSKGKYVSPAPIENKLLADPLLEQACVTGASRPQPFALVVVSEDVRAKLASGELASGALEEKLTALRARVNEALDPHEQLECLVALREPWSVENGMLTPTLKVKRSVVEGAYEAKADGWYASHKGVILA